MRELQLTEHELECRSSIIITSSADTHPVQEMLLARCLEGHVTGSEVFCLFTLTYLGWICFALFGGKARSDLRVSLTSVLILFGDGSSLSPQRDLKRGIRVAFRTTSCQLGTSVTFLHQRSAQKKRPSQ